MALIRLLVIVFSILLLPTVSIASEWQIVPSKSSIHFKATQNNAPITGEFKTFSGDIDFDKNDLSKSYVNMVVNTDSVSTSFKDVQDALKTADWFDSKAFPKAVFTANDFKKTGDNTFEANGKLTLRDKTLPLILHFTLEKYTDNEALVSGHTNLKRTAFEVGKGEWASTKEIKDDVEVNFTIESTKKLTAEKK
ncbi:MAG: polyisoprenoid-binding protein [Gammaproteobacteria bacterium CG_4_10_14_0_8_um_filter_38_16]|nr:MAG: polyisoprenoid-binding protein [Gammaproteobacteria bacterium CG_4_10_14_0_8_um_filter_38_16]PJA03583.1 MAG: polyisoprenoid-binding protein [Gammaproteobacteria bacterium CG_4_10_14_0_2_um_filter_38_22]PJB10259.1 MAG: polyisoprenoid-binding protein [Gammaproteobacteria bacterium CG_4_9_14_3_um_filter_38_9]